jgi:hypothetical protein
MVANTAPDPGFLRPVVGEYLSAVTFVMDYVQLDFNGVCLTALTLPTVQASGRNWVAADQGWRDQLCERIGVIVRSASTNAEEIGIDFDDGSRISVSLRAQDYRGPEAINFDAPGQPMVVI